MRQRLFTLAALVLMASTLNAQDPRAGRPGGGRGAMRAPDPVLFNGPPMPEELIDLVALDSTQYTGYRVLYTNFMEQTRPRRDSLLEFRRQMREQFESGGMPQGGRPPGSDKMQKLMGELEKQQKVFDETLKPMLSESQFKRYEAWRKEEVARSEREMRERFGGGPPS